MTEKVVVVTGANEGIGLALARSLHAAGFRVAALDLSGENLEGIAFYPCDVTDMDRVRAVIDEVLMEWGQIDILVNNACVAVFAPFEKRSVEDTRREFEVNYFGFVNLITAVLPHMRSRGGGVIHNVGSTVGLSGFEGVCGYASTKGAIEALTRTLAIELAPYGIVVNLVYPPLTRTKSAVPLGIPARFMADPDVVGRKLAPKVGSGRAVVTPGLAEWLGVAMTRLMPGTMGRFLSSRAARARSGQDSSRDRS